MPAVVGIVNITEDSFSDGGAALTPAAAIARGEQLLAEGADWLDLGAESSNPDGQSVPAALELERLGPVLRHFKARGVRVSIDTYKPEVMRGVLALGADMINDITALRDPAAAAAVAGHTAKAVIMYARNEAARAERMVQPHEGLIEEIRAFFEERLATLARAGIAPERLILDPGMGLFLGSNPQPSLHVLKHLPALATLGRPLYVSTSRKSFIGHVLGGRKVLERRHGTLGTELWALAHGASYVRTHEVGPLCDAWRLWRAIDTFA